MGEQNNIEDKLRDKLNSREFIIKDSWQADMDAKLDAYNSQRKGGYFLWILGLVGTAILAGTIFYSIEGNSEEFAEYSPRLQRDLTSLLSTKKEIELSQIDISSSQKERIIDGVKETLAEQNSFLEQKSLVQKDLSENDLKSETELKKEKLRIELEKNTKATGKKKTLNESKSAGTDFVDDRINSKTDKKRNSDSSQELTNKEEGSIEKGNKNPKIPSMNSKKINSNDAENSASSGEIVDDELDTIFEKKSDNQKLFLLENNKLKLTRMNKRNSLLKGYSIKDASILSQNQLVLITPPLKSKWNASISAGVTSSLLNEDSFLNSLSSFKGTLESNPLYSIQLDFRIGKKIGNSLELSSGISSTTYGEELTYLDYFRLNSTSSYEFTETEMWQVDSTIIDSVLFIDSVFVTIIDSVEVIMMDTTYTDLNSDANGKRKYSYLEIPLSITYDLKLSNRSSILLSPELALGILTKNSGAYYNEGLVSAQTKTFVLNSSLGIGYKCILTKRIDFRTMFRVRKPLGNLNQSDEIIRKYWSHSITAGIGYTF